MKSIPIGNDSQWWQMVPKSHKASVTLEEKEDSNSFLRPLLRGDDPEIISKKAILRKRLVLRRILEKIKPFGHFEMFVI